MKISQQYEPFDPETVAILGRAFDAAWKTVEDTGLALIGFENRRVDREMLALRIIHLAQQGVRDYAKLQGEAVDFLARRRLSVARRPSAEPFFPRPIIRA
jgi:hypothetical protein